MPTYRYQCEQCDDDFRLRRRIAEREDPAECPECGETTTERVLTMFSAHSGSSSASRPDPSPG